MSIPKQSRKDSKEVDDFDISILKTLPRQLIGEAVSYIKNKKHLEELEARRKKKEEEERLSKVKCIPPWAKTLAGERKPDERKDAATQYEISCEGREGEREGSQEKYLKDGSDIGGDSSGEEGFRDGAMREYSEEEEEGDEEWRRKMEEEGRDEGTDGVGDSKKLEGDRVASDHEALEGEDDMGEDAKLKQGKIGSKDRGIDEEGDELEDRDKTDKHSDGDDEENHEKGSISSSKDGEATDDERRKKKSEHGETEDEETDGEDKRKHGEHDGDSSFLSTEEEAGKGMSDSDYEKAHAGSSGDELKADGMSSEFTEGGETRGSTELLGEGEMKTEAGDEQVGEEEAIEENIEERMGNDSKYLQKHFGNYLVKALAEIGWKRPADPIHYLAHRLYHFRHIEEMTVKNYCEQKEIQEARNLYAIEMQEQTAIAGETENIAEDEELEEAEIVAETVQEYEDIEDSTSADDISQFMSNVEPEERLTPAELGF